MASTAGVESPRRFIDDITQYDYESRSLRPFTYRTKNGRTEPMRYYSVPPGVIDDPEAISAWVMKALKWRGALRRDVEASLELGYPVAISILGQSCSVRHLEPRP